MVWRGNVYLRFRVKHTIVGIVLKYLIHTENCARALPILLPDSI